MQRDANPGPLLNGSLRDGRLRSLQFGKFEHSVSISMLKRHTRRVYTLVNFYTGSNFQYLMLIRDLEIPSKLGLFPFEPLKGFSLIFCLKPFYKIELIFPFFKMPMFNRTIAVKLKSNKDCLFGLGSP